MPIFNRLKKLKPDARPAKIEPRKLSFTALTAREAVPEMAADQDRREAIFAERAGYVAERKALQAEIAADTTVEVDPAVAAMLGEPPSAKAAKRSRVADLRKKEAVAGQAIEMLEKRITAARSAAERAVVAAARPEMEKRIKAFAKALKVVDGLHAEVEDVLEGIEAEGVSWGSLGLVKPHWLGAAQDNYRKIAIYLKELRESGYAV
ncbi:MAG: hypothetical protein EOS75_03825 [Mesorhizobium sp.]|nr:MAG: hypothetical protein EOS74_08270 [Mesorhizobium sp.]RWD58848.1 MAG: hypothetical protein EOS75_03825 [Mesorhizobium sp.]